MKSSKSEAEWGTNADYVQAQCDGEPRPAELFILVKDDSGWHVHEDFTYLFDGMESNRVEVNGNVKSLWITEQVKCIQCGHVWQAVHPFAKELTCGECGERVLI